MDFNRMQEIDSIRLEESQNADPEIKQIICGADKEALFHKQIEERLRLRELEEKSKYYNPNR